LTGDFDHRTEFRTPSYNGYMIIWDLSVAAEGARNVLFLLLLYVAPRLYIICYGVILNNMQILHRYMWSRNNMNSLRVLPVYIISFEYYLFKIVVCSISVKHIHKSECSSQKFNVNIYLKLINWVIQLTWLCRKFRAIMIYLLIIIYTRSMVFRIISI